ncbi:MAG: hypothetical protein GY827_00930 [Cytophagales bacterium]|nr:hypothetical protein [Cytophagales bacterium]
MRKTTTILFLFFSLLMSAQDTTKTKKQVSFSDFPIEERVVEHYNILELRYIHLSEDFEGDSVVVAQDKYKFFRSKSLAMEYYFIVRNTVRDSVVFYISSMEDDKPVEFYPFHVEY